MRDTARMAPEQPRQHPLEHRVPPPVLGLAVAVLQRRLPRRDPSRARRWLAAGVAGASLVLVGDAERRMRTAHTTWDPLHPGDASSLVTGGAFDLTRNPMYVAMAGVLTAHAIARGTAAQLLPVAAWVGFIDRFQVQPEERALGDNFGEDFTAYRQRVRRWL